MRAARVVVDLGMHLGLRVPDDPGFRADWVTPGTLMTPQAALEIAVHAAPFPRAFMESEIERYIGLPAQAISYKVGERVWLDTREQARRRHGEEFVHAEAFDRAQEVRQVLPEHDASPRFVLIPLGGRERSPRS